MPSQDQPRQDKQFFDLDRDQIWRVAAHYPFSRRISEVHVHHTWRPTGAQYRGEPTIRGMWRYHTEELGWSDIAQHVSVGPDGKIWTGRPWDRAPASARGFNGNATTGPFMIEVIGDFDLGEETLDGDQRAALVETVAAVLSVNKLSHRDIRFHNEMTDQKSCPGTSVDKTTLIAEVRASMKDKKVKLDRAISNRSPFPATTLRDHDILCALRSSGETRSGAEAEGELPENRGTAAYREWNGQSLAGRGDRDALQPRELAALAGHVVNLNQGRLSVAGGFRSTVGQVRSIVDVHLRREVSRAKANGRPVRLLFYAHGGLVAERKALRQAVQLLPWYRENQIFPIFFVWETGLLETLRQLVFGGQRGPAARGRIWNWIVEGIGRGPGRKIWSAMKHSAAEGVVPPPTGGPPESGGGTLILIEALENFLRDGGLDGVDLELYGLGHSAGSNFHSHFLPALLDRLPAHPIRNLFLLAPAIGIDNFKSRLVPRVGAAAGGVEQLTMFTMQQAYEEADRTVLKYQGSLLMLIFEVLETRKETPILGMQECLENDDELRQLFGIGQPSPLGSVVFSVTDASSGASASHARAHGAFDNDPPTMNAVVQRILGREPHRPATASDWPRAVSSEIELQREAWASLWTDGPLGDEWFRDWIWSPPTNPTTAGSLGNGIPGSPSHQPPPSPGRRLALTIGVDDYPNPGDRLSGCVFDARHWASALQSAGFTLVDTLENERASRSGILGAIADLVKTARAGDELAIHFSGHGTQVADLSGDEEDDSKDEALCPFDFRNGALIVDDDLSEIFVGLDRAASCTVFLDCCHSGTGVRVAAYAPPAGTAPVLKARFVRAGQALVTAHREFRSRQAPSRRSRDTYPHHVINFSACQPHELAYEQNGQGEFTLRAVEILTRGGNLSNDRFQRAVEQGFGPTFRQRPYLDCHPDLRDRPLLGLTPDA